MELERIRPIESAVATVKKVREVFGDPIVLFVDHSYVDVLDNWLVHARQCTGRPVIAVCLDEYAEKRVQGYSGVHPVRVATDGSHAALWVMRAELFARLCRSGVNFIHSDIDAIWLRDPDPLLGNLDVDIAFSQGTVWPFDVVEEWKFVLCCGFFSVRASLEAACVFDDIARLSRIVGDDQIAVNRSLRDAGVVWETGMDAETVHVLRGAEYAAYARPLIGHRGPVRVALLPHCLFQRHPVVVRNDVIVVHPLTPKTEKSKREALAAMGLWRV